MYLEETEINYSNERMSYDIKITDSFAKRFNELVKCFEDVDSVEDSIIKIIEKLCTKYCVDNKNVISFLFVDEGQMYLHIENIDMCFLLTILPIGDYETYKLSAILEAI